MNSLIAQAASIGVIAVVTMFPTPERLRDAIKPTPSRITLSDSQPAYVVIDAATYDDTTIVLAAPFDMDCTENGGDTSSLGGCVSQLYGYIQQHQADPEVLGLAPTLVRSGTQAPQTEQARRTLVEVCRLRWVMADPPADPGADGICGLFQ